MALVQQMTSIPVPRVYGLYSDPLDWRELDIIIQHIPGVSRVGPVRKRIHHR
jgi:hypothetical protein